MNKIIMVFLCLFLVFCGVWIFKSKTPLNRQINNTTELSNWWDTTQQIEPLSKEVSEEWYLDPRIPSDYVPVLGQDGLYMQVDVDGTIISYWKCNEDGDTLNWEKVNPDIPDYFEPVDGLENVYKVVDDTGKERYYKYVRNPDNSFTFVEVDSKGNVIDEYIIACETEALSDNCIPKNYMQIDGNIYAVKNKDGVIVDYKEKNEDDNGNIIWSPANTDKVNNVISNNNSQSGSRNNGTVTNKKYTIPIDPVDPVVTDGSQTTIPKQTHASVGTTETPQAQTTKKSSKTHTQKETYQQVQYEGDYKCTYEYTIIRTYDDYGNLVSSETQGPYLIDKTYAGTTGLPEVNQGLIESNIDNEIMRVTNGLQNNEALAHSVINSLNAERSSNGLQTLSTGGDAQKLATLFAADMATYDNTSSSSPMYGTIEQLMSRYGISNKGYALNIWRTTSDDSSEIHQRFQSIDNCRTARMDASFNQVGTAIYSNNGYYYVAEVLLLQ